MPKLTDLKTIKSRVDRCITFKAEDVIYDAPNMWVSFYEQIKANTKCRVEGDSDDFSLTYADFCVAQGFPASDVRIVMCMDQSTGFHLVCSVDFEGETYILCHKQKVPVLKAELPYEWKKAMTMADKVWISA